MQKGPPVWEHGRAGSGVLGIDPAKVNERWTCWLRPPPLEPGKLAGPQQDVPSATPTISLPRHLGKPKDGLLGRSGGVRRSWRVNAGGSGVRPSQEG